jgi:ATP-dependent phosphoenolpyruvate carboxykinase
MIIIFKKSDCIVLILFTNMSGELENAIEKLLNYYLEQEQARKAHFD